jgi:hypothetical protein
MMSHSEDQQTKHLARIEVLRALELYKQAYEEKWDLAKLEGSNMDNGLCHYFNDQSCWKLDKLISELIWESRASLDDVGVFFAPPPFDTSAYTDLHEDCIAPRIQLLETMLNKIDESL